MARRRRAAGFDFSQPFESVLREVVGGMHRGATQEARRFFDSLLNEMGRPQDRDPLAGVPEPYRVLGVLPDAPRFVVEAAYRAWAKLSHPDPVHGAAERRAVEEQMVQINAAVAAIRKARGWK